MPRVSKLIDGYRTAVAAYLGAGLRKGSTWAGPGGGILKVFDAAMRYGVIEGVRGLLDYRYSTMPDSERYRRLKPHVMMPANEAMALALLRSKLDLLRWDPEARRFRLPDGVK